MDYPLMIRVIVMFMIFTVIWILLLYLLCLHEAFRKVSRESSLARFRKKYFPAMMRLATDPRNMDLSETREELGTLMNFKLRSSFARNMTQLFIELKAEIKEKGMQDKFNANNYDMMLQAFRLPSFFSDEIQKGNTYHKIMAIKTVTETNAHLKEAVASRYLYTKDRILKIYSRIHEVRFGRSSPFKELLDDPYKVFTPELMVKYHDSLTYREENGLSMPNFIQWCSLPAADKGFKIFAVNEIRLFRKTELCDDLFNILKTVSDEDVEIAIIETLGELGYVKCKEFIIGRLNSASDKLDSAIFKVLSGFHDNDPAVVALLSSYAVDTKDSGSCLKILRNLYNYCDAGKEEFARLENSGHISQVLFEHVKSPYIY